MTTSVVSPAPSYMVKLDRAGTHLEVIEGLVREWHERSPCELFADCDIESREHRIRLAVFEPPSLDLNVPISECVHNLRTALDHIGYRLAVYVSGREPPPNEGSAGFPIDAGASGGLASLLGSRIGKPKAIPPTMRTALQAAQRYKRGNMAGLAILNDLNNCDKHRFPPLLAGVGYVANHSIDAFVGDSIEGPLEGPLEDGAVVMRFSPTPDTKTNMKLYPVFDVAFGNGYPGYGAYVLPYLRETLDFIRAAIVPSLRPFL